MEKSIQIPIKTASPIINILSSPPPQQKGITIASVAEISISSCQERGIQKEEIKEEEILDH